MSEDVVSGEKAGSGDATVTATASAGAEIAALRAKLVQSELKGAAIKAGMIDLDGVKLIDMATVKLNEAGEVVEAGKVMAAMRVAKPWLFGGSSSSSAVAPRAEAPVRKAAMEMSVDEWRAARAALVR